MFRSFSLLFALLLAAPAAASNYSATLASPTTSRFVAADISWVCGAAACQGSTGESRPVVLCEGLAKRAGRIVSFLVDGRALPASDLNRCNASAKAETPATAAGK
jgi:hypothetical protein